MVFSSYTFVFVFLPIVLCIYYALSHFKNKRIQHIFLVMVSLLFYGYTNFSYVFLILSSVLANYLSGMAIDKSCENKFKKNLFFILGLLFNIGLLGYFKYYDFFVENINKLFSQDFNLKYIILPLGISFYTFQQIAFLISVYKGEEHPRNFLDYILLISFFPQLVAGPIVFYNELVPQFQIEKNRYFDYDNLVKGIFIFVIGLFKKAVIADNLGVIVHNGYVNLCLSGELTFGAAWITALCYTLQIYFDFSGYSEMSIGLGKMFNFDIPVNFNSPYKSKSIREFWRRWHITLGKSLTKLIYIPLGGNRKGLPRMCINLFAVFLVSGIWHGAGWAFIIWGVTYGILVAIERYSKTALNKIPPFIRIAATFLIVNCLWVLFRVSNVDAALMILGRMFTTDISFDNIAKLLHDGIITYPVVVSTGYIVGVVIILYALLFFAKKNIIDLYHEFKPNYKTLIVIVCLLCIAIMHMSRETVFIYFNF